MIFPLSNLMLSQPGLIYAISHFRLCHAIQFHAFSIRFNLCNFMLLFMSCNSNFMLSQSGVIYAISCFHLFYAIQFQFIVFLFQSLD
jgi:hypothetical protein